MCHTYMTLVAKMLKLRSKNDRSLLNFSEVAQYIKSLETLLEMLLETLQRSYFLVTNVKKKISRC